MKSHLSQAAEVVSTRVDILTVKYVGNDGGTVEDWAHAGVAMRAVDAHTASQDTTRGHTSDGVWWIINDTIRCTLAQ